MPDRLDWLGYLLVSKIFTAELREFVANPGHIFRHIVGLYVGRAGYEEQLLVVCARSLAETLLSHIERYSISPPSASL